MTTTTLSLLLCVATSAAVAQGWRPAKPEAPPDPVSIDPRPVPPADAPPVGNERPSLAHQVAPCWNVGALSAEQTGVTVVLSLKMRPDARPEPASIRLKSFSGGSARAASRAFEAARRAILRCGARGFALPGNAYSQWRDIEITFTPENMRIK